MRSFIQMCWLAAAAFGVLLAGCSKPAAPTGGGNTPNVTQGVGKILPAVGREFVMEDLRQLGISYQSHLITAGQGPAKLEDWQELKKDLPKVYQALADGRYVMIWNTSSALMAEGPSRTILAYAKDAPTKGGAVLLGDGSVKNMTLKEFQSAPKAKGQ